MRVMLYDIKILELAEYVFIAIVVFFVIALTREVK